MTQKKLYIKHIYDFLGYSTVKLPCVSTITRGDGAVPGRIIHAGSNLEGDIEIGGSFVLMKKFTFLSLIYI